MTDRYSYAEKILFVPGDISAGLSLVENNSSALRIFRLLTGTCKLLDSFDGKGILLNRNYLKIPSDLVKRPSKRQIEDAFDEVDLRYVSDCFKKLSENEDFYKLIEFELINCLVAKSRGRYLEAFLFLYRIIEGVSYSIPLMYVSKSRSFNKTYKSLQKFIPKKESEGELAFFKSFMESHWSGSWFYNITFDLAMDVIEIEEMRPIYYALYLDKAGKNVLDSTEDEEIRMSFIQFYSFMIELRNRYFHFLQGSWQNNIKTSQVVYPDLFFKPIMDLAVNWMAVVLFEVMKFDIEKAH